MNAYDLLGEVDLQSDAVLGYIDRYMVPMHYATTENCRGLHYHNGWFNSYLEGHGQASYGSMVAGAQNKSYLPELWKLHRFSLNRDQMQVRPLGFYTGMLEPGILPATRKPTLICNQPAVTGLQTFEFEVYDMPTHVNPSGAYGSPGLSYLGGLLGPGWPLSGFQQPGPEIFVGNSAGEIVLNQPIVGNEFGYASFQLSLPPLPPGTPSFQCAMQVISLVQTCTTPGATLCVAASNAWGFPWQ